MGKAGWLIVSWLLTASSPDPEGLVETGWKMLPASSDSVIVAQWLERLAPDQIGSEETGWQVARLEATTVNVSAKASAVKLSEICVKLSMANAQTSLKVRSWTECSLLKVVTEAKVTGPLNPAVGEVKAGPAQELVQASLAYCSPG